MEIFFLQKYSQLIKDLYALNTAVYTLHTAMYTLNTAVLNSTSVSSKENICHEVKIIRGKVQHINCLQRKKCVRVQGEVWVALGMA